MAKESKSPELPSYERPPVIEVVCGMLFKELEQFATPHLGLWWQQLQPAYPFFEEQANLAPNVEPPSLPLVQSPSLSLLIKPPMPRVLFISEDQSLLVQVQKDRLMTNWRKLAEGREYPRYGEVLRHFVDHVRKFEIFLKDSDLGVLEPLQYELTYVNQLRMGDGWEDYSEIGRVLPDLSWRGARHFLPKPESLGLNLNFPLPEGKGRLHLNANSGVRNDDGSHVLQLTLTARGIEANPSIETAPAWFDLAREWIVRGFSDIISDEMEQYWGRVS